MSASPFRITALCLADNAVNGILLLLFPVQIVERQSDAVLPVRHQTRVERLTGLRFQAGHLRTFAFQRAADHAIGQLLAELLREDLVSASLAELPGASVILHALVRRALPDAPRLDHRLAATRARAERLAFAGLLRQLDPYVWIYAFGQAFFSLSVAGNGSVIYGSYLSKNECIPSSARNVALFDTIAALLAAFVIIPAMAAGGAELDAGGPGLMFIYLVHVMNAKS